MNKDKKLDKHGQVEMTEMNYSPKRPKAANPVKVQDLTFRDGHQSLFATRGRTEDKVIVAEEMDKVGFYSMEVWGGATFDTMHRYLNEDPWERISTLKKYIKQTPFSMLLRGQNLVGYRNYADDVVEAFVQRACEHGIDIFRVFDACNDFRNFQTCVKIILKNKKHFQGTICYSLTERRMGGEVYNLEYYLEKARQLADMGADSICIKDMAGLIAPYDAYNLVKALKETVTLPINLHSHFTSGMADLTMLKAIEAGVDPDHILLAEQGDVMEFAPDFGEKVGHVQTGSVLVDGVTVGEVTQVVLRYRKRLAEDGIVVASVAIDAETGQLVGGPDLLSRGFVAPGDGVVMEKARLALARSLKRRANGQIEYGYLMDKISDILGSHFFQMTHRRPMILPVITEI
jgi:hypothetical protein